MVSIGDKVVRKVKEMLVLGKPDEYITNMLASSPTTKELDAAATLQAVKDMIVAERAEKARLEEAKVGGAIAGLKLDLKKQTQIVAEKHVKPFAEKLERIIAKADPEFLTTVNDWLRARNSGPLDFTKIAQVAVVHRHNVLKNNNGDSPFKGIARLTQLDNRQIRKALDILVAVEFTSQLQEPTKPVWGKVDGKWKKQKGAAGRWEIERGHWEAMFCTQSP